MTLLAAYQVLLSRYSGQDDVAVGVPIAGRIRQELEGLIGFFVNMLVLRGDLSEAPAFTAYLAQVRARALSAYAQQEIPFEKLVEELAPKRDLSRNPLFQVSMVLHNMPPAEWNFPGLVVERIEGVSSESAKFDLALSMREEGGRLRGTFEYARDLFEAATIERMAQHWRVLLEALVTTPEQSVARLPLMSASEREKLLDQGMAMTSSRPAQCVHGLFAAQAARTPEATAVVLGTQHLTYRELDARANRLAQALRTMGVGPDVLVGICLPRSFELVVAMLGTLKAGGAYLPLDPGHPPERLAFMLQETSAPVLLTHSALRSTLPAFGGNVVCMDGGETPAAQPDCAPHDVSTPNHLAYVIYTSGSTGSPKGVMVSHASVVNLALNPSYATISEDDTIGHASNVAFDAATFEIWGALLNGARLAILETVDVLSAPSLVRTLERQRVTCMFLTTTLFNEIADADPTAFRTLRTLLFGGEMHDPERVRAVMLAAPPRHLIHVYGPTETTTFATFHEVRRDDCATDIPIGRPVAGAEIFLLDAQGAPVPEGVVGEIHIGGPGVARGYLNRPRETAERFVSHPLRPEHDTRVFRSGDLARWTSNGTIQYVGRNDYQVKIRGFRIEPGEIAAVIRRHPSIRAAHVLARPQANGERGLTAYFVADAAKPPVTSLALQRHVAAQLPPFMVPVSWVPIDAMPITPNGKLDVRALPDPAGPHRCEGAGFVAPRDDVEQALCRIWANTLGVTRIGIDDDFFSIGGHSLLAARMFSRIDLELGRSLPLGALFEAPTVRQLAERVRDRAPPSRYASLVAVTRGGTLPPVHVVPGVFGNVVGFADLGRALGPAQPLYALQSVGLDGTREALCSIEEMARHYLGEVRHVQPAGPYAFAGACFGATVAYEMARQAMEQGDTVAYLGLIDPTSRGGQRADQRRSAVARPVKRAMVFASFAWDRLKLYRLEMHHRDAGDRLAYATRKLRTVLSQIRKRVGGDVRRELHEREVYRSNVAALDQYRRLPLRGEMRMLAIMETARSSRRRSSTGEEWKRWWDGEIVHQVMPGKDSGDMLSGSNVRLLAALMAQQLRAAFAGETVDLENSRESDPSVIA
jgi:amino acid adenylation domain-containing protein